MLCRAMEMSAQGLWQIPKEREGKQQCPFDVDRDHFSALQQSGPVVNT